MEDPFQAFAEFVRVVRPGGRVVVAEPDYGTVVVDATDRALTQRILAFRAETTRNGWIGRQLSGLAQQCGLVDVTIQPTTPVFTDWALASELFGLQRAAERVVSPVEAAAWIRDLEQRAATGRFFSAITVFVVSGSKP